jgi:hypothetical protein
MGKMGHDCMWHLIVPFCVITVSVQICFWLIENNFRVLIAACDTFRAGAVEQLRTHTRHLNALHPADKHGGQQMVQLYEKGYGVLQNYFCSQVICFHNMYIESDTVSSGF